MTDGDITKLIEDLHEYADHPLRARSPRLRQAAETLARLEAAEADRGRLALEAATADQDWKRAEAQRDTLAEALRNTRAERDYYRRRWLVRGVRFPAWMWRRELLIREMRERFARAEAGRE